MPGQEFRTASIAALAMTFLMLSSVATADDLVAIADLEFIRATDQPAVYLCLGERDEDCSVWGTFNVYKARIRKVISGTESRKTLLVRYGRHALAHKNFRGIIATLNKLEPKDPPDPEYQVVQWGEKRQLFCFDRRDDDVHGYELKKDGEDPDTCYDAKPRD
jgi:hypothetical protein